MMKLKIHKAAMILAIDIGNTNMEFGVYEGDTLCGSFRLGTNRGGG